MGDNIEREVKFLSVDIPALKSRLSELGAEDRGEHLLSEVIFYSGNSGRPDGAKDRRYVRIRTADGKTYLTYKKLTAVATIGVEEVEIEVSDPEDAETLLIALGWDPARRQEKKRHTFILGAASIEIDTWPGVPPYIEIEAPTEEIIRSTAESLGLDWNDIVLQSAAKVLKEHHGIDVWNLKKFTFDGSEQN